MTVLAAYSVSIRLCECLIKSDFQLIVAVRVNAPFTLASSSELSTYIHSFHNIWHRPTTAESQKCHWKTIDILGRERPAEVGGQRKGLDGCWWRSGNCGGWRWLAEISTGLTGYLWVSMQGKWVINRLLFN